MEGRGRMTTMKNLTARNKRKTRQEMNEHVHECNEICFKTA